MSAPGMNPPVFSAPLAAVREPANNRGRFDRLFFSAMAVLILLIVFVGFARSYYLAGVFKARLPSMLIHVHGLLFSCWILFLIFQTSLVAGGRVDLHRRLGQLGFGLAYAMVVVGLLASMQVLARPPALGESPRGARAFFAVPIADLLVFSILIFVSFRQRFNPAAHKRFVLIGTIALLDAAFVRWPVHQEWWTLRVAQMGCYPLLLVMMCYDGWSLRKVHRATVLASILLVFAQQARRPIGRSAGWQSFARSVQTVSRSFL